ncbi:ATP-binding cassette domain-containing protein [Streptomyces sp. NPDC008159]|uniref:ATP-binding cassette domain-containing protein n=1 Tax=Streptomyces sp. NPDC008159 TaxID=3364817 RepID=UPI0036E34527
MRRRRADLPDPTQPPSPPHPPHPGLPRRGLRFLWRRVGVVVRLVAWSVLEAAQTFLMGYALARALDDGFLAGRAGVGLGWLGVGAAAVVVGAFGTGRVYGCVAALVEPLRDRLVRGVVERGVREADDGALSGLTQQVEIARDTFAGLVLVSRSFVFTAAGALIGLFSLAPPLLLVVVPPLVVGVALFLASLRPLARRQEAFLVADEALATGLGTVCPGLRDITAAGAEESVADDTGRRVDAEYRAARSLARWGVLRVASLAVGGQLPVVLLLAAAPWLLARGVTAGALIGALAYVTQSLLPALQNLVHGLGTSGSRLAVVLRRLAPADEPSPAPLQEPGPTTVAVARPTTPRQEPATFPTAPARKPASPPATRRPALAHRTAPRTTPAAPPLPPAPPTTGPHDALTLSSVTFAYGPAAAPVIEDLDLRLPRGTHLAVVGPSGIGKSTLAGIVAGLLRPRHGSVHLCGHRVPGATSRAHRVLIPQEAYVFRGSLAENLGELRPKPVPREELWAAAEAVGLTELMERLGGPGAEIDPGALSAGERQLIALARAHLSDAPVVILDEATCHLDPEAEERAERAFVRRPGTTLVVVAHRVGSARRADRVLVMDGRRVAFGTHDDLMTRSPLYGNLMGTWSPTTPVPPPPTAPVPSTPTAPISSSEPTLALGDPDGVDPVARARLAGDRGHVVAHGPVGQMKAAGDLRDGGALGSQG